MDKDVDMCNVITLQDVCMPLYERVNCTKLGATMTLVNICIVHGCSNKFVDELFSLHGSSCYLKKIVCQ